MEIDQFIDNKWYRPKMKGWIHQCCKCGSKHKVQFKKKKIGIEFKWQILK